MVVRRKSWKRNSCRISNSFAPKLTFIHVDAKVAENFEGNCLKQDKPSFTHTNVVKYFIFYELISWSRDLNDTFTLKDCLFEAVKIIIRI